MEVTSLLREAGLIAALPAGRMCGGAREVVLRVER
jgi:hypothetical protein